MRVYITVDIEGIAGVIDFSQGDPTGGMDYALGQKLMTLEANAAIAGAFDAGATEVVVNDGHGKARNIMPELLDRRARLIQGRVKPLGICAGVDDSFDLALAVGYHAPPSRADGILNHAYHPFLLTWAGVEWDEVGLVAAVAGHFGVPLALVTGDEATIERSRELLPPHVGVAVKKGLTRFAADSLHPEEARDRVHAGAKEAVERRAEFNALRFDSPIVVEETLYYSQQADMVMMIQGMERVDGRTIRYESPTALDAYRTFIATSVLAQHPNVAGR
ncbi:MAG: M55 family metallopeptidase [Thermomicrobiales bacterium]